jgi:cbb3-type cytochrome oxidase maturation protein
LASTVLLILVSLVLGVAAWLLFLWAVKSDQYDDVERPKHRMLDDNDVETGRPAAPAGKPKGEDGGTKTDAR